MANMYRAEQNNPVNFVDPLGLSTLYFDPNQNSLYIHTESAPLAPVLEYPAANNTIRPNANPYSPNSYGPVPEGTFSMGPFRNRGNDSDSSFGIGSFSIYLPLQVPFKSERPYVLLHSGRVNHCDKKRRCGVNYPTLGCIRTTDDAIRLLKFDPPTTITIGPYEGDE